MNKPRIAIRLESLGLLLRRGLEQAARLGVGGIQVDAVGDLAPAKLSQTGRREFRNLLRAYNLELAALGCPLRRGLDAAEDQQPRIEHVRKVMTLAFDLGCRIAVVEAGRVPEKPDDPRGHRLDESLHALGQHGDRIGAILALHTGLEPGENLRRYLDRFDTGGLGVCLDPAALLLRDFDPYESTRALQGKIAHALARDARRSGAASPGEEIALGHGDIDWLSLLSVLEEVEYRGWLAISRSTGDRRAADIEAGVAFLRRLLP